MPIVSLAALTILDAGPVGQIEAAAAAGFSHVGLRLNPLLETDAVVVGHAERERDVEHAMAASGLKLLEVGVFPIRAGFDFGQWRAVIAFSAKLGGRSLVCPIEAQDRSHQLEGFQAVADLAADHGMDALVEFNPYSGCRSLGAAVDLVRAAGRGNTGLVIDAFHLSRSGGHPNDLKGLDKGLVRLVHFCDAAPLPKGERTFDELKAESRTARMLPGEGVLWLDALLGVLADDVPLSIEAPSQSIRQLSAVDRAKRTYAATMAVVKAHQATVGLAMQGR